MITVENLTKTFRSQPLAGQDSGPGQNVVALDNVSLDVPAGAVYGVFGPGGAGKSTLARCLGLVDRPDSGAIKIDGTDMAALEGRALRAVRRQVGVVPSGDSLLSQRTAAGNVALPLEAAGVAGVERRSRVAKLLDVVGLTTKTPVYPEQLSASQRQRVAIAYALADNPSVLIADDPTAELDPASTDSVLTVLERARSELGVTVLVATQDLAVVRRIADDLAILERGRVVEQGQVLDLVADPSSKLGTTLFPETDQGMSTAGHNPDSHDVVAEVVLVGFAAVGALLPEASSRFGVDLAILGGGLTRIGETPVAKFRVGLRGERSESALKWMIERDAHVRRAPVCLDGVAAA